MLTLTLFAGFLATFGIGYLLGVEESRTRRMEADQVARQYAEAMAAGRNRHPSAR